MESSQNTTSLLDRRATLKVFVAGAGLCVGFLRSDDLKAASGENSEHFLATFLRIDTDNHVTLFATKSEMGQGAHTGLAMLIAEELQPDWALLRVETAPSLPQFGAFLGTGGSSSITSSFNSMRMVGAVAREMLREAAAVRWNIPITETRIERGEVIHDASGRRASYGSLIQVAAHLDPPTDIELKPPCQWTVIGTSPTRLDTPAKVDGSAKYGADIILPGMLVGAISHCPVFGGKLKAIDSSPALAIRGVHHVLNLDTAVIVVGDGYWPATIGLSALQPQWEAGPNQDYDDNTIGGHLSSALEHAQVAEERGDTVTAMSNAALTLSADYEVPYVCHAPMEPMNATASVSDEKAEIWAPVQVQTFCQIDVANALNLDPADVLVHTTYLGGGFGRRADTEFVVEAALASRACGRPVKLIWSREQDTRHSSYRPRAKARLIGGITKSGTPVAISSTLAENSYFGNHTKAHRNGTTEQIAERGAGWMRLPIYNIPHFLFSMSDIPLPVPVGAWRSVEYSHTGFFGESFIDEMAALAGQDPLSYRRAHISDSRAVAVLDKVAIMSGWGKRNLPAGSGLGVAVVRSFGSYVAEVIEVSVTNNNLKVVNVWCAVDCGTAVYPSAVERQLESAVIYALSAAMYGEINIREGAILQSNFNSYNVVHIDDAPDIHVAIVNSGEKLGGIGEPGVPPTAPALTNAIYAATGRRIRDLPLAAAGLSIA